MRKVWFAIFWVVNFLIFKITGKVKYRCCMKHIMNKRKVSLHENRSITEPKKKLKLLKHGFLLEQYKDVNTDANDRWERGIDHHSESKELMKHIEALDFEFMGDYFKWKVGGDGDNGEQLMYLLDMYFEMKEKTE